MAFFHWEELPDKYRNYIVAARKSRARYKFVLDEEFRIGPEVFHPGFEAREFSWDDIGDWDYEVDKDFFAFHESGVQFFKFGRGNGFSQIEAAFRPQTPVKIHLQGYQKGYSNPNNITVPAFLALGDRVAYAVREEVFHVIQAIDPLPNSHIMDAALYIRGNETPIKYYVVDAPKYSEDDIDFWSSHCRVVERDPELSGGRAPWSINPVKFGTAYKPHVKFHFRQRGLGNLVLSKDLIYTLTKLNVGIVSDYTDPHKDKYGHIYKPKMLLKNVPSNPDMTL